MSKKILIIADKGLGTALKTALRNRNTESTKLKVAQRAGDAESTAIDAALQVGDAHSMELNAMLQQENLGVIEQVSPGSLEDLGQCLFPETEQTDRSQDASFFHWRIYDWVVIQDVWVSNPDGPASSTPSTLSRAGYCFAEMNSRLGNFVTDKHSSSTRVLVVITETSIRNDMDEFITKLAHLGSVFFWSRDEEDISVFCDLILVPEPKLSKIPSGNLIGSGSTAVQGLPGSAPKGSVPGPIQKTDLPYFRIQDVASLRRYVLKSATMVLIDDELKPLISSLRYLTEEDKAGTVKEMLRSLTEEHASVALKGDGDKCVHLVTCDYRIAAKPVNASRHKDFDSLVKACTDYLESTPNNNRYVVFITDLSFRTGGVNESGIDLIQRLNEWVKELDKKHQMGIIAFTGFTSPFYATSAYHLGADFVILKTEHISQQGMHNVIALDGSQLLLSLAFLCFQKNYLHAVRQQCCPMKQTTPNEDKNRWRKMFDEINVVLPKHLVSFQLEQEWQDTRSLLDYAASFGTQHQIFVGKYTELRHKYGE